jgi:hypothetical protein
MSDIFVQNNINLKKNTHKKTTFDGLQESYLTIRHKYDYFIGTHMFPMVKELSGIL